MKELLQFLLASFVLIWILLSGYQFEKQWDILFSLVIFRFSVFFFLLLLSSFTYLGMELFLFILLETGFPSKIWGFMFFINSGELQPLSFQLCLLASFAGLVFSCYYHPFVELSHSVVRAPFFFFIFAVSSWLCARIWVTSSDFSSNSTVLFSAECNLLFHSSTELFLFL